MGKVKDRERNFKAAREKQWVTYKGTPKRLSADFSAETLQTTGEWHVAFKVRKQKNLQPRTPRKAIVQNQRRVKEIPRQAKTKSSSPLNQPYKC